MPPSLHKTPFKGKIMARQPKRSQAEILEDMVRELHEQRQRVERADRIASMHEPYRTRFSFVSACLVKNDKAKAEGCVSDKCHEAVNLAYAEALDEIQKEAAKAKAAWSKKRGADNEAIDL